MRYLCLIYADESKAAEMTPAEGEQIMAAYLDFTRAVQEAGVYLGGEPLEPVSMATTVRVRNGKMHATDGPFAETKEQLGGYYMLDCENLDEALKWASQIPAALDGCIEVRPIMELNLPR
ncbi:MAG: YciI family protein [Acidobacteria bacterium]|nr:YciI family protein [Acidobacteriota bacterium]